MRVLTGSSFIGFVCLVISQFKSAVSSLWIWAYVPVLLLSTVSYFWRTKMRFASRLCYMSGFLYHIETGLLTFAGPLIALTIMLVAPGSRGRPTASPDGRFAPKTSSSSGRPRASSAGTSCTAAGLVRLACVGQFGGAKGPRRARSAAGSAFG